MLVKELRTESAQQAKGLRVPNLPTDNERALHNMTHLPFRSWCLVCLKVKSKSDQHRRLKLKSPVIQVDFAFWIDRFRHQLVLLTGIDVLSSLLFAAALPSKETSPYAVTELKRFVYETGRTYGIIQSDKESAI